MYVSCLFFSESGYWHEAAVEALKESNNDTAEALMKVQKYAEGIHIFIYLLVHLTSLLKNRFEPEKLAFFNDKLLKSNPCKSAPLKSTS